MKFVLTKIENPITDDKVLSFYGEIRLKEYVFLSFTPADLALIKEADTTGSSALYLQVLAMLFRKDEERKKDMEKRR